ncbi:zinc finger CCCH domain-containing protein 48 [Vitis vinifera]|uniref:zinc finger CCCH domain-containing protein 48 n=1 Tax=Vitis vinifera TaxID=29760 RepID=UPI00019838E5|nr:zinc finger CCCH domain-containing protein 48 [Vitis vinifera]|eukprot:XP_010661204.1 PREDICTED: zinc finger CCCH domain-containing protein 48-like [Vitis vinifera]
MFVWVSGNGDVRVWDCHTGRCVDQGNLGAQIGFLISQGPWLFAGLRNLVKAWNLKTEMQYSIDGPVGQVYALEATTEDVLFAGTEDGSIFIWKCNPESNSFPLISILKGHTASVLSLQVGCKSLYSSSMDNMIRIWACGKDGSMGVTHTRDEEHPILALFGMDDAYDKPILCCSCNDNSAILYELPSFTKRGTIFGKQEVGRIQSGPGGLFFTGDGTGLLHALF